MGVSKGYKFMCKRFNILAVLFLLFYGCTNEEDILLESIRLEDYERQSFDKYLSSQDDRYFEILLDDKGEKNFMISNIDKLICHDGHIYVLDWINRKIVVFDMNGQRKFVMSRRGRGPGEYLQISDFDIDDQGNIIVFDGQQDCFLRYDHEGRWIDTYRSAYQVNAIKSTDKGIYFIGLAPWNNYKYKGHKILTFDQMNNIRNASLKYDKAVDPNYTFTSPIFHECDTVILYHQPIDDFVVVFNRKGKIIKKYFIDFGLNRVPDVIRSNIQINREKLKEYSFLVKSIYIDNEKIIGSLMEDKINDFIIDRKRKVMYVQESGEAKEWFTVGISNGYIFFQNTQEIYNKEGKIKLRILPLE